jgi:hypothetical protein
VDSRAEQYERDLREQENGVGVAVRIDHFERLPDAKRFIGCGSHACVAAAAEGPIADDRAASLGDRGRVGVQLNFEKIVVDCL